MSGERANIFDDEPDIDLSEFKPKPKEDRPPEVARAEQRAIEKVGQGAGFVHRDPWRHRTGRNIQINLRVTAQTEERFRRITKDQNWVMGETLEHALGALEAYLARKKNEPVAD